MDVVVDADDDDEEVALAGLNSGASTVCDFCKRGGDVIITDAFTPVLVVLP